MALEHKDRVADATSTTGTGTVTLLGSAPTGFRTFAAAGFNTGATVRYSIASFDNTEWEVGEGIWTSSGATLSRATVYASSNAGALVNFSAGTKNVVNVNVAADATTMDKCAVYLNTATDSTTAGWQKVPVDTVDYDTNGMWNATNKNFVPKKAGYYLITFHARYNTSVGSAVILGLGFNGTQILAVGTESSVQSVGGTVMKYANGTTDTFEMRIYNTVVRAYTTGTFDTYAQVIGPLP